MKTIHQTVLILLSILWMTGCNSLASSKSADKSPPRESIDILFLAMDQSESQIFKLLLPEIHRRNLKTQVFTLGRADTLFADTKGALSIAAMTPLPANFSDDRTVLLNQNAVTKIVESVRPNIVVTGMSHAIEAQLSNHFREQGSIIIALYDHFGLISQTPHISPWLKTITGVDELLLPGHYQAVDAGKLAAFQSSQIAISGHPVLEQWDITFLVGNPVQQKQRLGLDPKRPIILFAGGHDSEYQQWLTLFLQSMAERPDIQVLIAPHPQTNGQLERDSVQSSKLNNVLVMDGNTTIAELATVADLVVTFKSIIGFQAAWQELPVIFIAGEEYNNILTDAGLASRASSWQQILNSVYRYIDRPQHSEKTSFKMLGVPDHSLQRITDHLQTTVKQMIDAGVSLLENLQIEDSRQ